jgi:hypothetical protein
VAHTLAPSFAMAIAVARPIPCAAEVIKAVLPESLPLMKFDPLVAGSGNNL